VGGFSVRREGCERRRFELFAPAGAASDEAGEHD
jgi:hypothetical protein